MSWQGKGINLAKQRAQYSNSATPATVLPLSTCSIYAYKEKGVAAVADSQVKNTYALKLKEIREHLRMKVNVVSRQKYGAIWAILEIAPYSLFEKNVERYQ